MNIVKIKDCDHLTGKYWGAAHSYCNLTYKNIKFLPFIYNLTSYDVHKVYVRIYLF